MRVVWSITAALLLGVCICAKSYAFSQSVSWAVTAPQAQGLAATSMSCSRSCTFVPGSSGPVGTLATGMNPVLPLFSGSYTLVTSGCTDPADITNFSLSGATISTTAPPAGPYHICVRTDQSGMASRYDEFTVVGVSGATPTVPAIGMTAVLCNNAFAFMPCTFSTNAANNIVFGLSTGLIPQSAGDGGQFFNDSSRVFYDPASVGGLTPNYQLVANGCPDPGDTTHFSFATRSDNANVKTGLLVNATTPGVYHACVQVNIPGTVNTPQYQEVTVTGVNDSINGIVPASFTLSDQAAAGSLIVLQCTMTLSPDCTGKSWSMPTDAHFTLAGNGQLTTNGTVSAGTYNLSVTVSGFTQVVQVTVVPYAQAYGGNFNGGTTAGILFGWDTAWTGPPRTPQNGTTCVIGTDVAANQDCLGQWESPRLTVQLGKSPDFSDAFTSTTGGTPCRNNWPPSVSGGDCSVAWWGGGWITTGLYASGYPQVVNLGNVAAGINDHQMGDYGGGAHSNGCGGPGYQSYYINAALGDPVFVQGMTNQINQSFVLGKDRIYMMRLSWEWNGDWYCHSPFHYSCTVIGQTNEATWFGGIGHNYCVSPTQWAQAQIQTIQLMRQLIPGVKIAIDVGLDPSTQAFTDPLIPYIDLWMTDNGYWTWGSANAPGTCNGHPCTGTDAWNNSTGTFSPRLQWMTYQAAYAKATNKPLAFTEWMDASNDGVIVGTLFPQWALANGVVLVGYWGGGNPSDLPPWGGGFNPDEPGATYPSDKVKQNALRATWGVPYTGSYWTKKTIAPADLTAMGW